MRTPTLAVQFQLLLGCNTYFLFNTDIVNFVLKTEKGEVESTGFCLLTVLEEALVDEEW